MVWFLAVSISLLIPTLFVVGKWLIVFGLFYKDFWPKPRKVVEKKTPEKRIKALEERSAKAQKDIKTRSYQRLIDANDPKKVDSKSELMSNAGIAVDLIGSLEDEYEEDRGDSWLCNGRPVRFAFLQLIMAIPISILVNVLIATAFYFSVKEVEEILGVAMAVFLGIALIVTIAVTIRIIVISWEIIEERTRGAVKRLGVVLDGYLSPGLHFILPWFPFISEPWEEVTVVPLYNVVWAPERSLNSQQKDKVARLSGALGDAMNPEEGKLHLTFANRYSLELTIVVVLRIPLSDREAWSSYMTDFKDETETGQQVAQILTGVIGTLTREQKAKTIPDLSQVSIEEAAQKTDELFEDIMNVLAEVASSALDALIRQPLRGGLMAVSVSLGGMKFDDELMKMLRSMHKKFVGQVSRRLEQAGEIKALELSDAFFEKRIKDPVARIEVLRAFRNLEILKSFADKQGGGNIAALLTGAAANVLNDATNSNKKGGK